MLSLLSICVGLYPADLNTLYLPSLKTEERTQSQWQIHQWLMDGRSYMHEARSWNDIPPCAMDSRQDMAAVLRREGRGRWPVVGGIEVSSLVTWHTMETSRGSHPSPLPFDKLSWWNHSDLKIRPVTGSDQGKVHRPFPIRLWLREKVSHVSSKTEMGPAGAVQAARGKPAPVACSWDRITVFKVNPSGLHF